MRIFSLDTEEQSFSQVKCWWIYLFHLRKRYTDKKQSIVLIINYMMISKIVVLMLNEVKDAFNDVVSVYESQQRGVANLVPRLPLLCFPCLSPNNEAKEREPGKETCWGFTNYCITQKKYFLKIAWEQSNLQLIFDLHCIAN